MSEQGAEMATAPLTSEPCGEPAPAPSLADGPDVSRRYVYCVIDGEAPAGFGAIGVDDNAEVYALPHDGIAAVVSATASDKAEISRGNILAHQRVMEAVMQRGHTVLPVRFNTIAEDNGHRTAERQIIDQVLAARRDEILGLLATMRPLVELGVKALWTNMQAVFEELLEGGRPIRLLRNRLLAAGGRPAAAQIRLGEMVKEALETRKRDMEAAVLARLTPLAVDVRSNKTLGDLMFANLALLVKKEQQDGVQAVLSAFEAEQAGQAKLRFVGPLPPCSFVELVICWDD
jgi:hypothetical protein